MAPAEKKVRLSTRDVAIFDPDTPDKLSVASFIKRFYQIADIEGTEAVTRVLPTCLEGSARAWYISLTTAETRRLNQDLSYWEELLIRQFSGNRWDARAKAYRLKFWFSQEDKLPLTQYMIQKVALYHEGGVWDEDEIVQELWQGLDPELMALVHVYEGGNSVAEFTRRVQNASFPARRLWQEHRRNKGRPDENRIPITKGAIRQLVENRAAAPRFPRRDVQTQMPKPDMGNPEGRRPVMNRFQDKAPRKGNCFICGSPDHWSNQCPEKNNRGFKPRTARVHFANEAHEDSDDSEVIHLSRNEYEALLGEGTNEEDHRFPTDDPVVPSGDLEYLPDAPDTSPEKSRAMTKN
jgi:hypothetical protein